MVTTVRHETARLERLTRRRQSRLARLRLVRNASSQGQVERAARSTSVRRLRRAMPKRLSERLAICRRPTGRLLLPTKTGQARQERLVLPLLTRPRLQPRPKTVVTVRATERVGGDALLRETAVRPFTGRPVAPMARIVPPPSHRIWC